MGTALVVLQCLIQFAQFVIRWTRHHPFVMLRSKPEGTKMERILTRVFAVVR